MTGDLSHRAAAVVAALERRAPRVGATPLLLTARLVESGWPADAPGGQGRLWVHLLQDARRTTDPDPLVDARIVVLELAARASPPEEALLREGLTDPAEAVRWTAERWLGQ